MTRMKRPEREARRDVFLRDTADYYVARPGYPTELLDAAVEMSGMAEGARVLEVGCGTGELTEWLARRRFDVLALDRSSDMLRFAEERLGDYPNVELRHQDFDQDPPTDRFDGFFLATSYHWLEPTTRARRCAERIAGDGTLALLWHTHPAPYTGYFERVQPIYQRIIPEWQPPDTPGMTEQKIQGIVDELEAAAVFRSIERRSHDWARVYDRDLYLRLLNTYSDHRLLADDQRSALFAAVSELIDTEYGGSVERPYRTELILASR